MNPNELTRSPEFERDLRGLLKRFSTLEDDLDTFIKTGLRLYHEFNQDNGGILRLSGLGFEEPKVYKVKKFACRSLKGKGGEYTVTVVFADQNGTDSVDPRLSLIVDEGVRKVYAACRKQIETTEALRYFIDNFNVSYLNINEANIEDIVRNAYERNSGGI
ncbi:MAG: hypothetical protein GX493_12895 [Firmicutes bacterium]|nr:hypothetical protein [Bacillota bacterium]